MGTIAIIILVVVAIYAISRFLQRQNPKHIFENMERAIEEIEKNGNISRQVIFAERVIDVSELKEAIEEMEKKYIRLKEKFKHEPEKRIKVVRDWFDYLNALREFYFAAKLLDVDMEEGASDRFDEKIKEPVIRKDEIEKRFDELLEIKKK